MTLVRQLVTSSGKQQHCQQLAAMITHSLRVHKLNRWNYFKLADGASV